MIFLGGVVGLILIAMYLPIFQIVIPCNDYMLSEWFRMNSAVLGLSFSTLFEAVCLFPKHNMYRYKNPPSPVCIN